MPALRGLIAALICASAFFPSQAQHASEAEPALRLPFAPSTPAALRTAWLDFHRSRLCQEIDAVFVFHERGFEAWCLTENPRTVDRLKRITGPLASSYRVDLYVTLPQPERDEQEDREPPPGLWNNQELREYLGNLREEISAAPAKSRTGFDDDFFALKRRIQMFADQTLELALRLKRYAIDLPELSAVAYDPGYAAHDSTRARSLCLMHAAGVDECASKLDQNLRRALPSSGKRPRPDGEERASPAPLPPWDTATEIAREASKLAQRVNRFVYPDQFTVGIEDLREPSLLESLSTLRRMTADFQTRLKKD